MYCFKFINLKSETASELAADVLKILIIGRIENWTAILKRIP